MNPDGDPSRMYVHHAVRCAPRRWDRVADAIVEAAASAPGTWTLYGIWRPQIGRPRDELTVMTVGSNEDGAPAEGTIRTLNDVIAVASDAMQPTLRPDDEAPPIRQGNFAFRWFELPTSGWAEFLTLCEQAWPGFESAYDSQVIGLWRCVTSPVADQVRALLLTRRPDLAMWERSKSPANPAEVEVRRRLSRRYDLCDATCVYTTTLLTAEDRDDDVRWS